MPDTKITALTAISTVDPAADPLVIVDVSDTSMAASGTTKKITSNQILNAGGTATLASATITGNLTVDTNTLFVDATSNNVGLGTVSPSGASGRTLEIYGGAGQSRLALKNDTTGSASTDGSQIALVGSQLVIQNREASEITFETNNSERYRLASDGVATWSNVGGVAGTAMTLNSTGLGVGDVATVSRLQVRGSTSDSTSYVFYGRNSGGNVIMFMRNDGRFIVGSGTVDNLIVTETGNVGIGTIPKPWRSGARALQLGANGYVSLHEQANGNPNLCFAAYEGSANVFNYSTTGDLPSRYVLVSGTHQWYTAPSGTAGNAITWTQAMTLDASGRLLVGTTSTLIAADVWLHVEGSQGIVAKSTGGFAYYPFVAWNTATSGDNVFSAFGTEATYTARGSISYNRAGGLVAYNTTSDYRAKDIIGPVSNSGSLIDSLKVYVGRMKGATIERPMLIAHEAQEVAPYAVTGTKDEVDADGKPKYQQMDASALVPLLIAEIQSLRARVQTIETR